LTNTTTQANAHTNFSPPAPVRGRASSQPKRWLTAIAIGALALSPVVVGADQSPAWADGTSWSAVAAAEPNQWRSVAYGNGVWVAVSDNGTNQVMRSTNNGETWTAVPEAEPNEWASVAYGNGVWVAVSVNGKTQVMRSTDNGATWTPHAAPAANRWTSVAHGNGVWVAVSSDGTTTNTVMTSTDGLTWASRTAPEANQWRSVAYGNGVWVAVSAIGTNRVMRSVDNGETWTAVVAAEDNAWFSVAYGNGVWVAVSATGTNRVMRSTDNGETWTRVLAAEANSWQSVAYGDGVWVAVSLGGTNQVMRSVDASIGTGTGTGADSGTPGIFLHITGPVGRSVAGSPVYYGADRVQVTSTYTLTLTPVGGNRPPVTMLAEGTIELNGSFSTSVRLDPLAPGSYDVQFTGTHRNGATLELTSRIVVGPGGEYMLIGDNIPIIR